MHQVIDGFLGKICEELGCSRVSLNAKHEATLAVSVGDVSLSLAVTVDDRLEVCQIASTLGTIKDKALKDAAVLLMSANLSIADLGGLALALVPFFNVIHLTGSIVGVEALVYPQFRAMLARVIDVSLVWKSELVGNPVFSKMVVLV